MRLLFLLIGLLSTQAFAQVASEAKIKFCQNRLMTVDGIQKIVGSSYNQLAYPNYGGFLGGGVCWWHSRFTRAAAYLAVFDPSLPKPSYDEAKKIIQSIRDRNQVITIPGYTNLQEFSLDYFREITSKLGDWQRADALLKVAWVKGLSGNSKIKPDNMTSIMDELYKRVLRGEVVYQMLQMPGIMAHAWLVTGMTKLTNGYQLSIVDSNIGNDVYRYISGDQNINYLLEEESIPFVPYTGQTGEEEKLKEKLANSCAEIIGPALSRAK
jgi:hypothetical protein